MIDNLMTINQQNKLHTQPVSQITQPCLKRWFRQICFIPYLHNRWLDNHAKQVLSQAVSQAEIGHRGEVFLVVENTLPLSIAYRQNSYDRAIQVFSDYRVWDTADNTGVLVYLNVCEHRLEIIADRGIYQYVMPSVWQAMCDKALEGIKTGKAVLALSELLQDIGALLRQYYQLEADKYGNELSDTIVYLR